MKKWRDKPLERQIEILKILQGKSMKTADIERHFRDEDSERVDPRMTQRDLEALRDGIEILGTTVKIEEVTTGHSLKSYNSTMHPIFLALNLTEVSALVLLLERAAMDPGPEEAATYQRLFDLVYSQLTDYAKDKLKPYLKREHEEIPLENRLDEAGFKNNILYLLKSGRVVDLTYTTKSGKRIARKCRILDYDNGQVTFQNLDKNVKVSRERKDISIDWSQIDYK